MLAAPPAQRFIEHGNLLRSVELVGLEAHAEGRKRCSPTVWGVYVGSLLVSWIEEEYCLRSVGMQQYF